MVVSGPGRRACSRRGPTNEAAASRCAAGPLTGTIARARASAADVRPAKAHAQGLSRGRASARAGETNNAITAFVMQ